MLAVGGVLAASVAVALGAARSGLPALAAFLGLGMLLGSDGPGGIAFDDARLAREVGVVSLAAILYEGGLSTSWRRLREVAVPAVLLSTVGVVVTAGLTGAAARGLFDLSWAESLLLGAVVASTDAAAVFATLRHTRLRRSLARTLGAESGANDPVAIALTLGLIAWIERRDFGAGDLTVLLVRQLGLGLAIGVAASLLATWVFARIPSSIGAFVPVASVAAGAVAFGAADAAHGSGFLAVYLVGLAVGSTPSRYRGQLVAFHVGLAYVAQVALFIVLGLLVFPSRLPHVALASLGLTAVLIFVARPVAVWASTVVPPRFDRREQLLLGWAGLRGAVPIVLGTFVLSSHVGRADTIFNAVFFVVLVSAVLQGTTLEWVAGKLGLLVSFARTNPPIEVNRDWHSLNLVEFTVAADQAIAGSTVRELGLPRDTLVAVVVRGDEAVPPRGTTTIQPGDVLFVLAPDGKRPELEDVFSRWRQRI
ncbi:MAG TPA: potassium/proton antiporter [Gaiellaceae bacterium]|nr:potassium/proton antiporter [Gaiellaceae bacterium]